MKPPRPLYTTRKGEAYVGDSLELLNRLADASVDLVFTSPPFALQRQKASGNKDQDEYVDWLLTFAGGGATCPQRDWKLCCRYALPVVLLQHSSVSLQKSAPGQTRAELILFR